jgi:ribosomal protein S18 acetylase RimI-like enzyme
LILVNHFEQMPAPTVRIRPADRADIGDIIDIDAEATGLRKVDYWHELFARYGSARGRQQRFFLVALRDERIVGFIVGETRDWEFGSPPCGWVFGISVRRTERESGVASQLLAAICEDFRRTGVTKVRTLLARDDHLVMAFFRSQDMMAAPFIALERDLTE